MRQALSEPKVVTLFLFLQIIPLLMFPPASFSAATQEWWLPVLLAALAVVGVFQLVFRHSLQAWPWYLVGFAQGFNIISRLMMIMPHATYIENGQQQIDVLYISLSLISMLISGLLLWYIEWPEVRMGLVRE